MSNQPKHASGDWTVERLREYLGGYSSYELRLRAMSKLINVELAAEADKWRTAISEAAALTKKTFAEKDRQMAVEFLHAGNEALESVIAAALAAEREELAIVGRSRDSWQRQTAVHGETIQQLRAQLAALNETQGRELTDLQQQLAAAQAANDLIISEARKPLVDALTWYASANHISPADQHRAKAALANIEKK